MPPRERWPVSSRQACRRAKITYRQLHHWTTRGFLRPIGGPQGSGVPWLWSQHEVKVAGRIARLTAAGLRLDVAVEVARSGATHYRLGHGVIVVILEVGK